jgi:hypothetical protein
MGSLSAEMDFFFNIFSCIQGINYQGYRKEGDVDLRPFMGSVTFNDSYTDKQFKDIKKYNRIAKKYHNLTRQQQRQCAALFDSQYQGKFPPELYLAFHKKVAPLALFSTQISTVKDLIRVHTNKNKVLRSDIQVEITKMFKQLEEAWKGTK